MSDIPVVFESPDDFKIVALEKAVEVIAGDVKAELWERDDDGYVICPDCSQCMLPGAAGLVGEHAPDCRLVRDMGTARVEWGGW
jgi:hypothetical protein